MMPLLVSVLRFTPDHTPLTYRCLIKISNWNRPAYLINDNTTSFHLHYGWQKQVATLPQTKETHHPSTQRWQHLCMCMRLNPIFHLKIEIVSFLRSCMPEKSWKSGGTYFAKAKPPWVSSKWKSWLIASPGLFSVPRSANNLHEIKTVTYSIHQVHKDENTSRITCYLVHLVIQSE